MVQASREITTDELAAAWNEPRFVNVRDGLTALAGHLALLTRTNLRKLIDDVIAGWNPAVSNNAPDG